MDEFKIAIIGAGSSYTPEIVERLAARKDSLPVTELAMMDINEDRLAVMGAFCRRFMQHLGHEIRITTTSQRACALDGARFVLSQIRVGGNAQRVFDEKIPLKYGIIGQETTGPGGMMKAMRTLPVMVAIANDVTRYCPDAWIINYTNPTGMVAEAVTRYTTARIAGLCSGGLFPRDAASRYLGVPPESVQYDYFGLNHLNFAYNLTVYGRPLTPEELDKLAEWGPVDTELVRLLRLFPSPYLQYYFHRRRAIGEAQHKTLSRGEEVQALEREIFSAYACTDQVTKPDALARRGGGGYSEVALGVMEAVYNNVAARMIINVPNQGVVRFLPDDAVIETSCLVDASGIHPLVLPEIPPAVWGLVAAVKNYEQLAIKAAITRSKETALQALLAHPLVADYDIAKTLLDDLWAANQEFL
jgi:6-phospho-beta-glucosidase